jgi:hypothetical protein
MRRSLVAGVALAALLCATPTKAAEITFETLVTSNGIEVPIRILDVEDLFAFELDVSFNQAAASFLTATEGPFLSTAGPTFFFFSLGPDEGFLTLANTLLGPFPGASDVNGGLLATLFFSGGFDADVVVVGARLLNSSLEDIPASVSGVTPVPEPSTLGLLGIGLWTVGRRLCRKPRKTTDNHRTA